MLVRMRATLARIAVDIRQGRHVEAYAIFVVGMVLAVLGIANIASSQVTLAAVLVGLSFLVFRSAESSPSLPPTIEVRDRSSFRPFAVTIESARELWVYGPTAVNVLVNVADIRRGILDRGGKVRVIVQDPNSPTVTATEQQLDANLDFKATLNSSIGTLARISQIGSLEYRLLSSSPGFSIVAVNPNSRDAFIIVEFHGYRDDNIGDRMHIEVRRSDSPKWFDYWKGRYEAMWADAAVPPPAAK